MKTPYYPYLNCEFPNLNMLPCFSCSHFSKITPALKTAPPLLLQGQTSPMMTLPNIFSVPNSILRRHSHSLKTTNGSIQIPCQAIGLGDRRWAFHATGFLNLANCYILERKDDIAEDLKIHDAMIVPVILGSDKTTVSVATAQNDCCLFLIRFSWERAKLCPTFTRRRISPGPKNK
jgi:hypothetical protein